MDTDTTAPGGWSAVVYGRTYQVDHWWRARPDGLGESSPVGSMVRATVAGGRRLRTEEPRFVLGRGAHGLLVGGACMLSLLDDTMDKDEHGRPLYGFVGWHTPDRSAAVPSLEALHREFAGWAGPVYREWTALTWNARTQRAADPRISVSGPAPWAAASGRAAPAADGTVADGLAEGALGSVREPAEPGDAPASPAGSVWLPAEPYSVHLLPGSEAGQVWAAARERPWERAVLVTGWRETRDADFAALTHLCSADITHYRRERVPVSPPVAPPPLPPRPPARAVPYDRPTAPDPEEGEDDGLHNLFGLGPAVRGFLGDVRRTFSSPDAPRPARGASRQQPSAPGGMRRASAYEEDSDRDRERDRTRRRGGDAGGFQPGRAGGPETYGGRTGDPDPYRGGAGSPGRPGRTGDPDPYRGGAGSPGRPGRTGDPDPYRGRAGRPDPYGGRTGDPDPYGGREFEGAYAEPDPAGAGPGPAPVVGWTHDVAADQSDYSDYFGGFDDEPEPSPRPPRATAAPEPSAAAAREPDAAPAAEPEAASDPESGAAAARQPDAAPASEPDAAPAGESGADPAREPVPEPASDAGPAPAPGADTAPGDQGVPHDDAGPAAGPDPYAGGGV
ncbi:hypothetical protein [Actinacidiphila epipremni]|uniref:Uncharacterized protein n=1 Tax=Actinacidiphila epipremni TaxID=2053013 RepID=A0ABX0ZVM8_9ACTN|nr:hypothetical protein [Actinacidiphila epipremni]NJP45661.1 hypothetical protein [Actinacidiphila epipremni]